MSSTHVMKFVHQGRTHHQNRGIRTFPHHTYGISKQSPDHFHQTHTLTNHGYHYDHQQAPKFQYHSQKKSYVLPHEPFNSQNEEKNLNLHKNLHQNPHRFHLKKGRLTQFWDKNGWMKTAYLMSGHQRSERSRSFNNRDRDSKIKNLKQRIDYESQIIKKPIVNQNYYNTLQELMSQRVRIRTRRNKEAQNHIPLSQRTLSQMKVGQIQGSNIRTKMAQTTQQWFHPLKNKKVSRQFSNKQHKFLQLDSQFDLGTQNLEQWQRKTCNSKWCYKAPKKDLFEESQPSQVL